MGNSGHIGGGYRNGNGSGLGTGGRVRSIGVVGSRSLGSGYEEWVGDVVEDLVLRGYHIGSGGAIGADQYVLERLLRMGQAEKGTIYAAWRNYAGFPVTVRALARQFKEAGGNLVWGLGTSDNPLLIKAALLARNSQLVETSEGLVAFIDKNSRGSIYTLKKAATNRLKMVVFPVECSLPEIGHVKWVPLRCGGCWEGGFKASYWK